MMLSRARAAAIFGALLLVLLAATLPLAAAIKWAGIDRRGFSARAVDGSIWSGSAKAAAIGPAQLGDLAMRLSPLALLGGEARFAFAAEDDTSAIPRGTFGASVSSLLLGHVSVRLPLPMLDPGAAVLLNDFSVHFAGGRCASASGTVTADVPVSEALLPGVGSLALAGNAVCEGARLLLPLTGHTGSGDAGLFIRIGAGGHYTYDLTLSGRPGLRGTGEL